MYGEIPNMKRLFCISLILAFFPISAAASPSTTPGYTAFDQAQFAKLQATAGTWNCVDTPASKKPDVIVTRQQGNYFVSRETGDSPSTSYARWSHILKAYFDATISDGGGFFVYKTTSNDPNNATWTPEYPRDLPKNSQLFSYTVSMSGNTFAGTGKYMDPKGRILTGKGVCTKQ